MKEKKKYIVREIFSTLELNKNVVRILVRSDQSLVSVRIRLKTPTKNELKKYYFDSSFLSLLGDMNICFKELESYNLEGHLTTIQPNCIDMVVHIFDRGFTTN